MKEYCSPLERAPLLNTSGCGVSNDPAVTVCATPSSLIQLTIVPTLTSRSSNAKFSIFEEIIAGLAASASGVGDDEVRIEVAGVGDDGIGVEVAGAGVAVGAGLTLACSAVGTGSAVAAGSEVAGAVPGTGALAFRDGVEVGSDAVKGVGLR